MNLYERGYVKSLVTPTSGDARSAVEKLVIKTLNSLAGTKLLMKTRFA